MKLGVVGTFVWDTIWTLADVQAGRPFETWGGVAYSLAAAAAARADGWEIVPIVKVGADLADDARRFMAALPGLDAEHGILIVPEANNRVELRYTDEQRRGERLTGGVSAWTWDELAPRLEGIDALYVNFLSGFEMGLETAERVRASFAGPIYADLHSLFLGCPGAGVRQMRSLPEWERWAACFHAIQLNEDELAMLGGPADESAEQRMARMLGHGPGMVLLTRGGDGVTAAVRAGFPGDPMRWPGWTRRNGALARATHLPPAGGALAGDPTGAGDVWGSTFFSSLLAGLPVLDAIRRAHRFAGAKMAVRGATGLYEALENNVGVSGGWGNQPDPSIQPRAGGRCPPGVPPSGAGLMATERELQFLDEAAGGMSTAERDALAGVNFFCVLRAVGRFVLCGPTNPECQRALVSDVLSCLGVGGGGDGGG